MRCGGQLTFNPFAAQTSGFGRGIIDGGALPWLSADGLNFDTGGETVTNDPPIYDDAGRWVLSPFSTDGKVTICASRQYSPSDGCVGGSVGSPSSVMPLGGGSDGTSNGPPSRKDPKKYLELTSTPKGEIELLTKAQEGTEEGREWMDMVRLGRMGLADYAELAQRPLVKALESMSTTVLVPRHDNFTPEERTPWGGTRIMDEMKSELGLEPRQRIVGESWEISGHPSFPNTFPLEYAGEELNVSIITLNTIFSQELYGEHSIRMHGGGMPFLVKLVNSGSWDRYIDKLRECLRELDNLPNTARWNRSIGVEESLTEILSGNHHQIHRALSRFKSMATKDALRRSNGAARAAEWRRILGINNLSEILNMGSKEFVDALSRLSFMQAADGQRELALELRLLHQLHLVHQKMLSKNLSVQVHPPADYDRLADNEHSKTEAWTIIDAEAGAGIYIGLQEGVTPEQFRAALKKGDDVTSYLNFVEVKPGDVFFIPAGTIHAIGAGVLLVEPQETSETTYRVYDYGRLDARGNPRQLHVDNAIAVTRWDGPRGEKAVATYRRVPEHIPSGRERAAKVERLLRESTFESSRITFTTGDEYLGTGKPGAKGFTVISGEVEVQPGTGMGPGTKFTKGQSFIIPASLGNYVIRGISGESTLIKTSVSLPYGIGDAKPTSSITNEIKSQSDEIQARNDDFVALDKPHYLIINPQGYMGPEVPMGSKDSGGQLTYVAEMSKQLVRRGYKVTIVVRSFKPEKEYESYGDRRGVAFMDNTKDHVRFLYVPGLQAEGAAFMRKEDIYSELPSMARNLDLFLQDEAKQHGMKPWESVYVINSHYVDGGVVGQLLQRRWGHAIIGDHLLERFKPILPPREEEEALDATNLMGNLQYNFGTCVVRAWRTAHNIDDSPAMTGVPVDIGEVIEWAGSKIGWSQSRTEAVIASLKEVEPNGLSMGREEAAFKIGYRLLHEAGDMELLEQKLDSIYEMHAWTPHSLGKLKEDRMIQAGRHESDPAEFHRMNFQTRETNERNLLGGALRGISHSAALFANQLPVAIVVVTSQEILDTAYQLGMSAAKHTIRFEPGTDPERYHQRDDVDDPEVQGLFNYLGQPRASKTAIDGMIEEKEKEPRKYAPNIAAFGTDEAMVRYFSEPIVPHDIIEAMRQSPQDFNIVVEAGRMDDTKQKVELIRAMQYLPENTFLFITGPRDRPEPEINKQSIYDSLRREIEKLGLGRRVFLLGMVPGKLMGPLMSLPHGPETDQFHMAIVASASRQEGWGMAVQDGTRGGMPLVATDFTPYAMHLDRTSKAARIVSLRQGDVPKRFADEIQRLIDNPPEARAMADRALKIAEQYEWGPLTDRFDRQLQGLLRGAQEMYPAVAPGPASVKKRGGAEQPPPLNVVVLAGGTGKPFEPYKADQLPEQFRAPHDDGSMLQRTVDRHRGIVPPERIWVATDERYVDMVKGQVPELPIANIIGEPVSRNTAPIINALMHRLAARDPNSVAVVVPSDHCVLDVESYLDQVKQAVSFVMQSSGLMTFGVRPTRPSSDFGYVKRGAEVQGWPGVYQVERFVEKPPAEEASEYLQDGNYLWNSGIFVWGARSYLGQLAHHQPVMHAGLDAVFGRQPVGLLTPPRALKQYLEPLGKNSVDRAILEPAAEAGNIFVIPLRSFWADVGT